MSKVSEASQLKVGDRLAFRSGSYPVRWHIYAIEKITPSGRIKAGHYEMNPDLTIRGRDTRWGPYKAEVMTDKIASEAKKEKAIELVESIKTSKLSDSQLFRIVDILREEST